MKVSPSSFVFVKEDTMKKLLAVIIAVMLCAAACAPKETAMDPVTPGTEGGQTAPAGTDASGGFISEED